MTPGHALDQTLILRVTPQYKEELEDLLDEHGLSHAEILEFSDTVQHVVVAVSTLASAGALAAVASVINTFIRRHNGKKIVLEPNRIEVAGYSPGRAEKAIGSALEKQAEVNDQWAELTGKEPPNSQPRQARHLAKPAR